MDAVGYPDTRVSVPSKSEAGMASGRGFDRLHPVQVAHCVLGHCALVTRGEGEQGSSGDTQQIPQLVACQGLDFSLLFARDAALPEKCPEQGVLLGSTAG